MYYGEGGEQRVPGLMQRVPGLMPVHKPVHLDFADYARGTLWIIQHSTTPDPS